MKKHHEKTSVDPDPAPYLLGSESIKSSDGHGRPETQERYARDTGPSGHCSENDFQEADYMWQEIINCVLPINCTGGRIALASARAQAGLQTKLLLNINI